MKKGIRYITVIALYVIATSSCKDFLDVNDDPDYPIEASSTMLISSGLTATAAYVGGDLQMVGGFWSQHYTQHNGSNQYNTTVNYNVQNTAYARLWSIPNAAALPDLKQASAQAEEEGAWNIWVVANTMIAFNYHIITDLYGASPYTEGFKEGVFTPKWDDGKTVNTALITLLDEVIAKEGDASVAGLPDIEAADFVFGGDIAAWIQFAKTLKLKILMRDFDNQKTAITALLADGLLTGNAAITAFSDKENNSNPLYENDRRKLNTDQNIRACKTVVDYLNHFSDPRINDFFEENNNKENKGERTGLRYGDRPTTDVAPIGSISRATLAPSDPVYFMSEAESYFLQAEAYARLNDAANAKILYDGAVTAAFSRWGYDAASFIGTDGAYAFDGSGLDVMLNSILTQKWIAATRCQAWDSFFDINRTGIPALGSKYTDEAGYVWGQLTPCVTSVLQSDEFPRRMICPKDASDYNPNIPKNILEARITDKMWWHKQ